MADTKDARADIKDVAAVHGKLNRLYNEILGTLSDALDSPDEETRIMAINLTSPALLTSATNWVKHNGVTANPEVVESVNELKLELEAKRKRVATISHFDDYKESYGA